LDSAGNSRTAGGGLAAGDLDAVERARLAAGKSYLEFLRVASMSAGVYALPAGADDTQTPHHEDELYFVVRGNGRFLAGAEDRPVAAGALIFVAAEVPHRFHDITEDLQVLVFFAPAETP
jgi:mannose-6-phosphate isomerase-like protein (cupin superfamily)